MARDNGNKRGCGGEKHSGNICRYAQSLAEGRDVLMGEVVKAEGQPDRALPGNRGVRRWEKC